MSIFNIAEWLFFLCVGTSLPFWCSHVEIKLMLAAVSVNCHLIERLFLESSRAGENFMAENLLLESSCMACLSSLLFLTGRDDSLKSQACNDLVNRCPHLTSLALRGFKLQDYKVRILVKVF